jgi:hypothetical protein
LRFGEVDSKGDIKEKIAKPVPVFFNRNSVNRKMPIGVYIYGGNKIGTSL